MNKFKKALYDITRIYAKNYLTGNLGDVVEDDEKITCYVKRSRIKKKDYCYVISCHGIGQAQKKIADTYKLNKPICYIIDGIELKKNKVYIFGYDNCEVIIKNCSFELDLCVHVNGKCTLDNTNIKTFSYLSISAEKLVIKNMNSNQIQVMGPSPHIGFGAVDTIDVIDSNLCKSNKAMRISFTTTNELNISNSNITGKEVECESKTIHVDEKSSLTATDKVTLKTDDFNSINITAPTIALNDEEIINEKQSIVLKRLTDPLEIKRVELVSLLRKIKTECEKISSEKISEYQKQLNDQPISKALK